MPTYFFMCDECTETNLATFPNSEAGAGPAVGLCDGCDTHTANNILVVFN